MVRSGREVRFVLALLAIGVPAQASLIFNTTYDLSGDPTSLNANLNSTQISQWESDIAYVEGVYSGVFTNNPAVSGNITINLNVQASAGTGILGESITNLVGSLTYSDVKAALAADATSTADAAAVTNLPSTDPTGGGHFLLATAQAKAMGLIPANGTAPDGTIAFGAGYNYAYDPANRGVPGEVDFIGLAEHEISEMMGRVGLLGANLDGSPDYGILDLFGYTAPGSLALQQQVSGAYFSIDGGVTRLQTYNDASDGGDAKDWASGTNDSYNAFMNGGVENGLSSADITELDVIGYTQTPEPGMLIPFLIVGAGFAAFRVRAGRRFGQRAL